MADMDEKDLPIYATRTNMQADLSYPFESARRVLFHVTSIQQYTQVCWNFSTAYKTKLTI